MNFDNNQKGPELEEDNDDFGGWEEAQPNED